MSQLHPDAADDVEYPPLAVLYKRYRHPKARAFHRLQRDDGYGYTLRNVQDFLRTESVNEHTTPWQKPSAFFPVVDQANKPFERVQIDLMDMVKFNEKLERSPFPFCFVMIDVFSRYAFVVPIKGKTTGECGRAFSECLSKITTFTHYYPERVDADSEPAFNRNNRESNSVGNMCHQIAVSHGSTSEDSSILKQALYSNAHDVVAHAHDVRSLTFVDRFIRTLRKLIIDDATDEPWYKEIAKVVEVYNRKFHSTLKMSPLHSVGHPGAQEGIRADVLTNKKSEAAIQPWAHVQLNVGDHVRVLKNRQGAFRKGTEPDWSTAIYPIDQLVAGVYYAVAGKLYRKYELLRTAQAPAPADVEDDDEATHQRSRVKTTRNRLAREGLDWEWKEKPATRKRRRRS